MKKVYNNPMKQPPICRHFFTLALAHQTICKCQKRKKKKQYTTRVDRKVAP